MKLPEIVKQMFMQPVAPQEEKWGWAQSLCVLAHQ